MSTKSYSVTAFLAINCFLNSKIAAMIIKSTLFVKDVLRLIWVFFAEIQNPDSGGKYGIVMESKQFDEHVNDIFFDSLLDERTMVASSGEGELQMDFYLLQRSFIAGTDRFLNFILALLAMGLLIG